MDFDEAIKAHSAWKIKLQQYLTNPNGSINVADLSKDNLCALGQWIYGEGQRNHGSLPEFIALIEDHKAFHKAAADIVARKNKGEDVHAETALGASSPFASCSSKVVASIMTMKRRI